METQFHVKLDALRAKLLEMAARAQNAVEFATVALLQRDVELAERVIKEDRLIDEIECEVDDMSLRLLALDTPVAIDLRSIVGMMRVAVNLERIGDQAVNIARQAKYLSSRPALPFEANLEELCSVTLDMLKTSIIALREGDSMLAREVCRMDEECDKLDVEVIKELVNYMGYESPAVKRAVAAILTSRSLERVGDLSTNIGEAVVFIIEGESIKHKICSQKSML
ncbi:phosphate signaling complex protein PhoU [Halodesulfovibrio sp. MK-HDV]|jgi:phosphate transport system protein|uniref:phosphate signaling complex protein PhoU n=1 Tax=unclassified Halodesulfovibrio TaxID=2644657 RepID=UPI00136C356D|nr:phosphate signaling complex protein PhoU [Halodesulfovibrio sp. MK-HDV]KAF1073855.1 Phosphate-specific transport system accessory protein PhoU [Halodesulfovibrio sp. MK-HDV]